MLSDLATSIREFKKPSLLAPLLVSGEMVMEVARVAEPGW